MHASVTLHPARPRSPLRYCGGKSRGVPEISKHIPEGTRKMVSPFLGGGSLEIACASTGITVRGYDIFEPLVNFWRCLLKNPRKLADIARQYHPLTKSDFYDLQEGQHGSRPSYRRAAIYFALNRASFSGTTLSGGMSPGHPRFTESSIERLENFRVKNFSVDCMGFEDSIAGAGDALLYLDPPYLLEGTGLYGRRGDMQNGFDHERLAGILHGRDGWILSYNDTPEILSLYSDYDIVRPEWKYGMSSNKSSREILVLSHDLGGAA